MTITDNNWLFKQLNRDFTLKDEGVPKFNRKAFTQLRNTQEFHDAVAMTHCIVINKNCLRMGFPPDFCFNLGD